MAKPPPKRPGDQDPRITDLRRYRKEREQAAKRKPNPKAQLRETLLGANPNAGLILLLVALAVLAYLFLPALIALFR